MKDYIVDVVLHIEVRAEDADDAKESAASAIAEAAIEGMMPSYTVQDPRCVGGDDDLVAEIAKELGVNYDVAEDYMSRIPRDEQERMSIDEIKERIEIWM